jgi:predicted metalloprotease with PDZ domain
MKIDITLDGRQSAQKYLFVTYVFQNITEQELVLDFPTWSPGSYLIREYQSQVEEVKLIDSKGNHIPFKKTNKHQWAFSGIKTKSAKLTYKVYANVLNVRGLYADNDFLYFNPCAALFHVSKQTNLKASLKIIVPPKWKTAISKKPKQGLYTFKDFDELYDTPAIAAKELTTKSFKANNTQYKMTFWGTCHTDLDKIVSDTKKIISKQNTLFKNNPCSLYLFIIIFSRQVLGGGLEHAHSSVNLFDGTALTNKKKYNSLLSLLSHEHFHLWNIKRFRPTGLGPYDYTQEVYTKDLWLVEGATSYYDDHTAYRAGLYTATEYLKILSDSITKLESYKATKTHSLSEASFDTWIKYYRPTENTFNTATNYYLKGSLVMLILDILITDLTQGAKNLDDVMLALYKNYKKNPEKQLTRQDFVTIAEEETNISLKSFIKKYVDGTHSINWKNEFRKLGITLNIKKDTSQGFLGVVLSEKNNRLYVQNITEDSPAFASNIQAGDEIIAVDRQAITTPKDIDYYLKNKKLTILYNRRGQIAETVVEPTHSAPQTYSLIVNKKITRQQKKLRDCFLRK